MANISLDNKADAALSRLQDTSLTPMEEALFKAWGKANQIYSPDAAGDEIDYRGIYKASNGTVLPNGQLKRYTDSLNNEQKLQRILHQRMEQHITRITGEKLADMPAIEKQGMGAQSAPTDTPEQHHTLKLQNEGVMAKNEGLQAKNEGLAHQNEGTALQHKTLALQNQGKQLDIQKLLTQRALQQSQPAEEPNAGQASSDSY